MIQLSGRLGNNLFQYAFGRIIAERHGLELKCYMSPFTSDGMRLVQRFHLDIGPMAFLNGLTDRFTNAPLSIPGRSIEGPLQILDDTCTPLRFRTLLEMSPSRFQCVGLFQNMEFYVNHRNDIRRWFAFVPEQTPFSVGPKDVLINIRAGFDFDMLGWTIPSSFYENVLSAMTGLGSVYVCGTGIDEHVKKSLAKFCPVYYSGTPMQHFSFMRRFNRIVLSNSTFAWWASYLSEASEIYVPVCANSTFWSSLPLHENRYLAVSVSLPERPPSVFSCTADWSANNTTKGVPQNSVIGPDVDVCGHEIPTIRNLSEWLASRTRTRSSSQQDAEDKLDRLKEWLRTQTTPFSIIDIPAHFLSLADNSPAKLLMMLFDTGLVSYIKSREM